MGVYGWTKAAKGRRRGSEGGGFIPRRVNAWESHGQLLTQGGAVQAKDRRIVIALPGQSDTKHQRHPCRVAFHVKRVELVG